MLKVNEIFYSIQGEGKFTGTPMIFIRLSGCNLKCKFCDTKHQRFKRMTEERILYKVRDLNHNCRIVCITGGEPFKQDIFFLTEMLKDAGYYIHIETNGTFFPNES